MTNAAEWEALDPLGEELAGQPESLDCPMLLGGSAPGEILVFPSLDKPRDAIGVIQPNDSRLALRPSPLSPRVQKLCLQSGMKITGDLAAHRAGRVALILSRNQTGLFWNVLDLGAWQESMGGVVTGSGDFAISGDARRLALSMRESRDKVMTHFFGPDPRLLEFSINFGMIRDSSAWPMFFTGHVLTRVTRYSMTTYAMNCDVSDMTRKPSSVRGVRYDAIKGMGAGFSTSLSIPDVGSLRFRMDQLRVSLHGSGRRVLSCTATGDPRVSRLAVHPFYRWLKASASWADILVPGNLEVAHVEALVVLKTPPMSLVHSSGTWRGPTLQSVREVSVWHLVLADGTLKAWEWWLPQLPSESEKSTPRSLWPAFAAVPNGTGGITVAAARGNRLWRINIGAG